MMDGEMYQISIQVTDNLATFLTGDMREIPFKSHFDAIINVGTSFGFFESEGEDRRVIEAVAKSLKPEGMFLLEMGNRIT